MSLMTISLQQMAKITTDTPDRMKPTKRSVIIQILVIVFGCMCFFIHQFYRDIIALLYPFLISWIIIALIAAYYEIDLHTYKLSLTSFRGFCISISMIINWICDILRHFLRSKQDKEPFLTIMLDNISFVFIVILMLSADSVPRIINFLRFLGPFCTIVAIGLILITDNILTPRVDYTIFTLYYGSLTINGIESACKLQIIWYGSTFVWAVPRDLKHQYFVFLDNKISVKTLIPMREYIDKTKDKLSEYTFHGISLFGVLYAFIYIIAISWRDEHHIQISLVVIDILLVILVLILVVVLMYKHFQWFMIKELLLQFRANMLIASILILMYAGIQELFWTNPNDINVVFIIETLLNKLVFAIACVLAIIRDGLNISYPHYFIILFAILLCIVSFWNLFLLTFGLSSTQYPQWFILIEKQAYFQMIVISYLSVYYLWRDRQGQYFSLIRKRRTTHELWGDNNHMDNVSDSFDIETDHQKGKYYESTPYEQL